ncbi:hypothetical protein BaRGS_00031572 [Batillaria attramentaria]|uniref:Uncharacterized protein n=1 Tax=Batillaria attramentaria TaxID=370345 RepID=A0ABD0JQK4_9CAEN
MHQSKHTVCVIVTFMRTEESMGKGFAQSVCLVWHMCLKTRMHTEKLQGLARQDFHCFVSAPTQSLITKTDLGLAAGVHTCRGRYASLRH